MPLESVLLLLDNSSHSLNGDYPPTRLSSMLSSASTIASNICNSNPESTCGVISLGGQVDVLCSLSDNLGSILSCMHGIAEDGSSELAKGVAVGLLALKHRRNKNGRQRIIVFVSR